jgi:hypothetical protein
MFWPKHFCIFSIVELTDFLSIFVFLHNCYSYRMVTTVLLCTMPYFALWTYSEVIQLYLLYWRTYDVPCKYCCLTAICRFLASYTSGEPSTVALRVQYIQERSNSFRRNRKTNRKISNKLTVNKIINFNISTLRGRCHQFNLWKRS